MIGYIGAGINVHGKPKRVIFWPKNSGSVRLEYEHSIGAGVDVSLFVGGELGADIYAALAPVLRKHGIEVQLEEREPR